MNVKRLRKIQKQILAEPDQFCMAEWLDSNPASSCGTTACIAGWACWLFDPQYRKKYREIEKLRQKNEIIPDSAITDLEWEYDYREHAKDILSIDDDQLAETLFFVNDWTTNFRNLYIAANTSKGKAFVASNYIDYFIEKYRNTKINT